MRMQSVSGGNMIGNILKNNDSCDGQIHILYKFKKFLFVEKRFNGR